METLQLNNMDDGVFLNEKLYTLGAAAAAAKMIKMNRNGCLLFTSRMVDWLDIVNSAAENDQDDGQISIVKNPLLK